MKQLDSKLPCVCSGRDTRWCHPVFITDTWQRLVCHFFCSYHAHFDGICERNDIFITNPCLFWPVPIVLVSKTERNSQGHYNSGVMKKRVSLGERNDIFITNPCLFWPVPIVLVSKTERNSQGHYNSGVMKKRVRFGSGRKMRKLISQHDLPLPFVFTPLLLSHY